jgi:HTH-type transcriptional regulator/antitoxin HigA
MITNERQYKITKSEAERFKAALRDFNELELVKQGIDPVIISAQRSSLEQQLKDLESQIVGYEKLRSGRVKRLFPTSITDIGQTLVEARIAQGLSQRALAERLGMKEQQIQRYEQERYQTANLTRAAEVAEALQLDLIAFFESRHDTILDKIAPNLKSGFDASKLPVKYMKSRGWLSDIALPEDITGPLTDLELAAAFVSPAFEARAMHRQRVRAGSTQDEYSLLAWKARVLAKARAAVSSLPDARGSLSENDITNLVKLSTDPNGPVKAIELLRDRNIIVVFERHLPATHLDGAAMLLDGEIPIIGLTLRYDRLDNFWFTLLHEVGHIVCHRDRGLREGFFDEEGATVQDTLENEADTFAESALIPSEIWQRSFVRFTKSPTQVVQFAKERGIGSAIVAGRIRRERGDWTLFNELIGRNSLHKMMASAEYWED